MKTWDHSEEILDLSKTETQKEMSNPVISCLMSRTLVSKGLFASAPLILLLATYISLMGCFHSLYETFPGRHPQLWPLQYLWVSTESKTSLQQLHPVGSHRLLPLKGLHARDALPHLSGSQNQWRKKPFHSYISHASKASTM